MSWKLLLLYCALCWNMNYAKHPIIIDNDGGVDDVIAATLQLIHSPEAVKAITIVPADCYGYPAVRVMHQLKRFFLGPSLNVPVGLGVDEGINLFPTSWREDSWKLVHLPLWQNEVDLNTKSLEDTPSAHAVLTRVLHESLVPVQILETGPCTNIAAVLREHPELKHKIDRIFIMGGALYVNGNVEQEGHDGSAEWNVYNNPQAFQEVLRSQVPITLIPLDATYYTPIKKEFVLQIAQHLDGEGFRVVHECLKIIQPFIESGQYFFWDTLASAVVINDAIVTTKKMNINVILEGVSMGRTIEDESGFQVDVAVWADQPLFEKTVVNVLLENLREDLTQ